MKFAIVILMVIAAAQAQFGRPEPQYNPFGNQFNRYNNFNRFNQNQNRYNSYFSTQAPYRPYSTITPTVAPLPVTSTSAPFSVTTPTPFVDNVARISTDDASAFIVKSDNEINPDGGYFYNYETSNGIAGQEQGTPRNFGGNPPVVPDVAQGSFSWTSPEGQRIVISYIADENGYQPQGNAIPTSPPVPEAILRSLDYIARTTGTKQ